MLAEASEVEFAAYSQNIVFMFDPVKLRELDNAGIRHPPPAAQTWFEDFELGMPF